MRSHTLVESETTNVALTREQADGLRVLGRKLASKKGWWGGAFERESSVIDCSRTHDGWDVRVRDAVGLIALPEVQLVVRPKIPTPHLFYLFNRAGATPRLDDQLGGLAAGLELWELMARWFIRALERLLRLDLSRDYVPVREPLQIVRGRIDVLETSRTFLGGRLTLTCEYDDFLVDTPLNRLLRACTRTIAASPGLPRGIRMQARVALGRMDEIGDFLPSDMRAQPDRLDLHYSDAITLAKTILAGALRDLDAGPRSAWTFLLRTPDLVESGLRAVLQEHLDPRTAPQKGSLTLTPSRLTLNPDLIFPGSLGVGDVKYKLASGDWRRADLYQVVAFATGFGVSNALMVDFNRFGTRNAPTLQIGGVKATNISWPAEDAIDPDKPRPPSATSSTNGSQHSLARTSTPFAPPTSTLCATSQMRVGWDACVAFSSS